MRVKLTISYDGTGVSGWQVQPDKTSFQEILENAIFSVTKEKVIVTGSGRTDAGVHALGQVAHFDTNSTIPPEKIALALNTALPPNIKVLKSETINDTFNARRSAKKKTYCYSIYNSYIDEPLKDRYSVRVYGNLDMDLLNKGAEKFVGEHDFKCLSASGNSSKTTTRTIYEIKIEKQGEDIKFFITGNGFLYNMVRILVGTLIKVGRKELPLSVIDEMLKTGNRDIGGDTLPPQGLCLLKVEY